MAGHVTMDHGRAAPSSPALAYGLAFIFPCLQPCTIKFFLLKTTELFVVGFSLH